jgi:glycosyltransferase involved in cell wall biosynthesis
VKIGISIKALQTGHRMRGIGSVVISLISNIDEADKKKHSYVFYMLKDSQEEEALDLLKLNGLSYEIRYLSTPKPFLNFRLPGKLNIIVALANKIIGLMRLVAGRPLPGGSDLDAFLQTDQSDNVPRGRFKKTMIAYDIIPYVLEWEYLNAYSTSRMRGAPVKIALRNQLHRWAYKKRLKINTRRADHIVAISNHTKKDYIKYLGVSDSKISVVLLGVSPAPNIAERQPDFRYLSTSWDYFKRDYKFETDKPFLLYVGGADPRRRLEDLVTAFNHLRAGGTKINLVLTGDSMQGPKNISTLHIQKTLLNSSYLEDIVFLGFVDDEVRNWLYGNALAFIYPSKYEGFGLPVLEAMSHGCPVICYDNSSLREVANSAPYYANSAADIEQRVNELLEAGKTTLDKIRATHRDNAQKFTWAKTAKNILKNIENA